jgi:hypothetical protein
MHTQIRYYTTDEVNHTLAQRMAHEYGSPLIRTSPGQAPQGGPPTTRLYDLDHLWPQHRTALVEDLLAGLPSDTVAVHGYCLSEDQMRSLRANGVIVSRSLGKDLFLRLCDGNAPQPDREPLPLDGDRDVDENQSDDLPDPAALCTLVRGLASRAHKTLRGPARPSDQERCELRRQLASLQTHFASLRRSQARQFEELQRWLDSLQQYVEHHDLPGIRPGPAAVVGPQPVPRGHAPQVASSGITPPSVEIGPRDHATPTRRS